MCVQRSIFATFLSIVDLVDKYFSHSLLIYYTLLMSTSSLLSILFSSRQTSAHSNLTPFINRTILFLLSSCLNWTFVLRSQTLLSRFHMQIRTFFVRKLTNIFSSFAGVARVRTVTMTYDTTVV